MRTARSSHCAPPSTCCASGAQGSTQPGPVGATVHSCGVVCAGAVGTVPEVESPGPRTAGLHLRCQDGGRHGHQNGRHRSGRGGGPDGRPHQWTFRLEAQVTMIPEAPPAPPRPPSTRRRSSPVGHVVVAEVVADADRGAGDRDADHAEAKTAQEPTRHVQDRVVERQPVLVRGHGDGCQVPRP